MSKEVAEYSVHLSSRLAVILMFSSSPGRFENMAKKHPMYSKLGRLNQNKYTQKGKENKLAELQDEEKRKRCHLVSKQNLNKMNSTTGKILMRLNWLQHPIYKEGAALQFLF